MLEQLGQWPAHFVNVVSVSGGKDSTATYCRALERGLPFRAVAADTGNEHPATYNAVNMLSVRTGGPAVEWVKADFSFEIGRKRRFVEKNWAAHGVPQDLVDRALAVLVPTGNPYLDLCIWKGRFPSRLAQFCTEELKVAPINSAVTKPLLAAGQTVVSWQGVRGSESLERSQLARLQRMDEQAVFGGPCPGRYYVFRPLLHVSSIDEVFAIAARHGIPPNPLYGWGCNRVGCFPCIHATKGELSLVDRVFPEQIDRLAEWERIVSEASKRGCATFFVVVNDPVMRDAYEYLETLHGPGAGAISLATHGIREMIQWAKTDRGGRQFNLFFAPEGTTCATHGACE